MAGSEQVQTTLLQPRIAQQGYEHAQEVLAQATPELLRQLEAR